MEENTMKPTEKIPLSKTEQVLQDIVKLALILLFLALCVKAADDTLNDVENALHLEQQALDNSGYNWTQSNYTLFQMDVDCGISCSRTIAEEQCYNGIQEACDYITIKTKSYTQITYLHKGFGAFSACCILPLCALYGLNLTWKRLFG